MTKRRPNMTKQGIVILFLVITFLIFMNFAKADLNTGLISAFKFDGNWSDSVDGYTNSTFTGTMPVSTVNGKNGSAYYYDGAGCTFYVNNTKWNLGAQNFSISVWVNQTVVTGAPRIFGTGYDTGSGKMALTMSGTAWGGGQKSDFNTNTADVITTVIPTYTSSTWTHFALVKNGTTHTFYRDGISYNWTDQSQNIVNPTNFTFGCRQNTAGNPTEYFTGLIDEFYFWNRTITTAEILTLNASSTDSFYPFGATSESSGNTTGLINSTHYEIGTVRNNWTNTIDKLLSDSVLYSFNITNNNSLSSSYFQSKNISLPIYAKNYTVGITFIGNISLNISQNNSYESNYENISCYQESANVSTSCGGLGTGTYEATVTSSFEQPASNCFDGDWTTACYAMSGGSIMYLYMNYSTLPNFYSANWTVMYGDTFLPATPYNNTYNIPQDCFLSNKISLKVVMTRFVGDNVNASGYCYNTSNEYKILFSNYTIADSAGRIFYEEAITWGIKNYSKSNINISYADIINNILYYYLGLNTPSTTIYNMTLDFTPQSSNIILYAEKYPINGSINYNATLTNNNIGNNYSFTNLNLSSTQNADLGNYNLSYTSIQTINNCSFTNITINTTSTNLPICKFYNAILNVSVNKTNDGVINNFSANISYPNGWSETHTTTSGNISFNLSSSANYTVHVDPTGYIVNTSTIKVNQSMNYYTFFVSTDNSINITIQNQLNQSPIIEQVLINFIGTQTYNFSTSTGNIYVDQLIPDYYAVHFTTTSNNYSESVYYVTIVNRTTQSLTVQMLPYNQTSVIGVYVKTGANDPVYNALISVQKQVNNTFLTVDTRRTDVSGFAVFNLQQGQIYQWVISSDNYNTKIFLLTPYFANSPYTFILSSSAVNNLPFTFQDIYYDYNPKNTTLKNTTQTFTLTVSSSTSTINYTSIQLNSITTYNLTGQPTASTITQNFDLANYSGTTFYVTYSFGIINSSTHTFTIPYWIPVGTIPKYNTTYTETLDRTKTTLGSIWTVIASIFLTVVVVITLIQLSGLPYVGTIAGFVSLIFFASIGWLDFTTTIFLVIVGLIILYFSRSGY